MGKGQIKEIESQEIFHEARLLQLNCEKAQQLLGWQPRWNADQSLEATALWYRDVVVDGTGVIEVTRKQILSFFPELA